MAVAPIVYRCPVCGGVNRYWPGTVLTNAFLWCQHPCRTLMSANPVYGSWAYWERR